MTMQSTVGDARGSEAVADIEEHRRIFVHEVAGKYSKIYERLFAGPRVYHSRDQSYRGGPQHWTKSVIDPGRVDVTQMFHSHLDIYVPGAISQRHAHMNSAVFYILEGFGHDEHDGKRIDWKAGDVVIVEPGCVHQHFNDSDTEFARMVVIKPKPLFIFTNLVYQKMIVPNSKVPVPGYEDVDPDEIDPFSRPCT